MTISRDAADGDFNSHLPPAEDGVSAPSPAQRERAGVRVINSLSRSRERAGVRVVGDECTLTLTLSHKWERGLQ